MLMTLIIRTLENIVGAGKMLLKSIFFFHVRANLVLTVILAQSVAYRTWEKEVAGSIPELGQFLSQMIDDGHCDRIHFSLFAVHCFDNGYVGKQSMAWKEYCA